MSETGRRGTIATCPPIPEVLRWGMDYIAELLATVERLHGCVAAHSRTESVIEMSEVGDGQSRWTVPVEVFALLGHDQALRCYAWGERAEGRWEVTTVLAIPPVVSARTAVLAALLATLESRLAAN